MGQTQRARRSFSKRLAGFGLRRIYSAKVQNIGQEKRFGLSVGTDARQKWFPKGAHLRATSTRGEISLPQLNLCDVSCPIVVPYYSKTKTLSRGFCLLVSFLKLFRIRRILSDSPQNAFWLKIKTIRHAHRTEPIEPR